MPTSPAPTRLLVSACLLGERVRYDGRLMRPSQILSEWHRQGRVVAFCPEVAAGLPVPREPAEIVGAGGGQAVIQARARVITRSGLDVSEAFRHGARQALALVLLQAVAGAVMKDGSPSCGSTYIYNGGFAGVRVPGRGVASAMLAAQGIQVFSERQLEQAAALLT